jgi:DNA-binding SARP family transcriptional activator
LQIDRNAPHDLSSTLQNVERLAVRVLGPFVVEGLAEVEIGSRKARTLLKVLACERGAAVDADRIADAVWGGDLPARPADQISVLVSRLRSVLGGRIDRSASGYSLRYDWLDFDELLARSHEAVTRLAAGRPGAARAAAAAALRLVAEGILVDEDADWADHLRMQVERVVADVRHVGAEAALAVGALSDAAALARDALDREPYDEPALQLLMRAFARLGRPGSALAAYAEFKARLIDEFGVGPTPATEAVHDAIVLGGDSDAGDVSGAADPDVSASAFVGRRAELDELDALLRASPARSQLVLIEGEPGIGKTALVEEWARRAEHAGIEVMWGRCDQLGAGLPLQPVLDAVNEWLVRRLGPSGADELAGKDPVLAPFLGLNGAVRGLETSSATRTEEPEAGRRRLFAALGALIDGVRGADRVAIVVEDVHHADPSTMAWLASFVRTGRGVVAVATSRSGEHTAEVATVLRLDPLDPAESALLIGGAESSELYERSGGNPLFLIELAHVAAGELPDSVVDAVRRRGAALGPAASTMRVAALLGQEIDLDLLARCCRRPVGEILDHIELAVSRDLLSDVGGALRFRHDVVREALVAGTTGSVRAFVHREASTVLDARADHSPMVTAHHAERGGATEVAANALVQGAQIAAERFATDLAEELLDRAIELADSAQARTARARVRLARRALDGAAADIDAALASAATAQRLELAGWIAYYRREHRAAMRFAQQARAATTSTDLQASAAILEGRIRHSQGDLDLASGCLAPVTDQAVDPAIRDVARVWLAGVRAHQGRCDAALASLDAAGDPAALRLHPFATGHAWFARCLASGHAGDLRASFAAIDGLVHYADASGAAGVRFKPFAFNMRSWLERSAGNLDVAAGCSVEALEAAGTASFDEPAVFARLDLVEILLAMNRNAEAAAALRDATDHFAATSTMAWHQHQRVLWLSGRLALLDHDPRGAVASAEALALDADARGSPRYGMLARHLAMVCNVRSGQAPTDAQLDELLADLPRFAALDAWRLVAELAAATGFDRLWSHAEACAATLVARSREVAHLDPPSTERWIRSTLDGFIAGR